MKSGVPAGMHCISYPDSPPNDFPTWDDHVAKNAPLKDIPRRGLDELATIIYTSGTTGMPKGVMHSFSTIADSTAPLAERYGARTDDRMLSHLPLSHVGGALGGGGGLAVGRASAFSSPNRWRPLPRDLRARAADDFRHGAAAVDQVPAGRVLEVSEEKARRAVQDSAAQPRDQEENPRRARAWIRCALPAAAPRRCRRRCSTGTASWASNCWSCTA